MDCRDDRRQNGPDEPVSYRIVTTMRPDSRRCPMHSRCRPHRTANPPRSIWSIGPFYSRSKQKTHTGGLQGSNWRGTTPTRHCTAVPRLDGDLLATGAFFGPASRATARWPNAVWRSPRTPISWSTGVVGTSRGLEARTVWDTGPRDWAYPSSISRGNCRCSTAALSTTLVFVSLISGSVSSVLICSFMPSVSVNFATAIMS